MQAILTRYLPATNTRGSRIKASCERGSITIGYPSDKTGEEAHVAAADALVTRFVMEDEKRYGTHKNPWSGPRVAGGLANGDWVHVFVGESARNDADARLITAAPELLEACESLSSPLNAEECNHCLGSGLQREDRKDACHTCGGIGEVVTGSIHPTNLKALRAAIAKAKGEQP